MSKSKTILQEASSIVDYREQEKDRDYGDFSDSMTRAAIIASEICESTITTEMMFKCMIALKMSRMSKKYKRDTFLDSIAYIAGLENYKREINNKDEK